MGGGGLAQVADIQRRDDVEPRLFLHLLDGIEHLDGAEIIDGVGALGSALAACPGSKDDCASTFKLGRELGDGGVLEGEEDRSCSTRGDVAEVVL